MIWLIVALSIIITSTVLVNNWYYNTNVHWTVCFLAIVIQLIINLLNN